MTHLENIKRLEQAAFLHFAACVGLPIRPETLKQPPEPEPDILIELKGESSPVAFELGRLNAQMELHRQNLMETGGREIEEAITRRTSAERDLLRDFLANARVVVSPRAGYPNRELRRAAAWIVEQLLFLPQGFEGPLHIADSAIGKFLANVEVMRFPGEQLDAAPFTIMTGDFARRADLSVLERKLLKRYECAAPIELLAYADRGEFAFMGELEVAEAMIVSLAPASVYRAVWLFEGLLNKATLAFRRPE